MTDDLKSAPLPLAFFQRPDVLAIARELLALVQKLA